MVAKPVGVATGASQRGQLRQCAQSFGAHHGLIWGASRKRVRSKPSRTVSSASVHRRSHTPRGVATDAAGAIYVADAFNDRLQKFGTANQAPTLTVAAGGSCDANDRSGTISGGAGNDTITAGEGNDNMTGGAGNDDMAGGAGGDRFSGGPDSDRADDPSGSPQSSQPKCQRPTGVRAKFHNRGTMGRRLDPGIAARVCESDGSSPRPGVAQAACLVPGVRRPAAHLANAHAGLGLQRATGVSKHPDETPTKPAGAPQGARPARQ